jgi:1-phosphofructokinase
MIVTLTPNPSLDRTLEVAEFARGEVLRTRSRRVEPGGKGNNVARALHAHGHGVRAVLPSGGAEGDALIALIAAEGLTPVVVTVREPVRSNVSIVEPDGTTTKINEPGPCLSPAEVDDLLATTVREAAGAAWVVGSGSLPPGVPDTLFASLTERLRSTGTRVAIDTSGPALVAAIQARPDLVKPNIDELEEATGMAIATLGEAVAAAQLLRAAGAVAVLASLGADGAVLVDADGVLHARQVVVAPRSAVGAGDATLAGYLAAVDAGRPAALRSAVAFGAAAARLPGSQMPGPSDVLPGLVDLTAEPELGRVLTTSHGLDPQPTP